jgi:hypothetical protein
MVLLITILALVVSASSCWCADIAWRIYEFAAHHESGAVGFLFLQMVVNTNPPICDIFSLIGWYLVMSNEEYHFGALDAVAHALRQSVHFIGKQGDPSSAMFGTFHEMLVLHGRTCVRVNDGK